MNLVYFSTTVTMHCWSSETITLDELEQFGGEFVLHVFLPVIQFLLSLEALDYCCSGQSNRFKGVVTYFSSFDTYCMQRFSHFLDTLFRTVSLQCGIFGSHVLPSGKDVDTSNDSCMRLWTIRLTFHGDVSLWARVHECLREHVSSYSSCSCWKIGLSLLVSLVPTCEL